MLSLPYFLATKYKKILNKSEQEKLYAQFHPLKELLKEKKLLDERGYPNDLDGVALLQILHPKLFRDAFRARDKLFFHNQRAVINIAQKFLAKNCGLDEEELIGAGQQGLTRAIWKFDPTRNTKFSSHAWDWIYEAMQARIALKDIKIPKGQTNQYIFTSMIKNNQEECTDIFEVEIPIPTDSLTDEILNSLPDEQANILAKHYGLQGKRAKCVKDEQAHTIVEKLKECYS